MLDSMDKRMKKFSFFLFFLIFFGGYVKAEVSTPLTYLKAMTQAHKSLNYELLYILQSEEEVSSFRYRHSFSKGKEYAQLLSLDSAREEIILRDNTVGYFGDYQPFSLKISHILDNLPSIIYTDFDKLSNYTFVDGGKARIADRIARIIRVIPRDNFRYQYILWIDEENHLLLQSHLLDRDSNILEQFRVIQSIEDEHLLYIVEPIQTLILPTLIHVESQHKSSAVEWKTKWIPNGFMPISSGMQDLSEILSDEQVESQLYTDGLFAFTIYVVKNKGVAFNDQFWGKGKTSVYIQTIGDKDIVIVGEIPLASARHIIKEIDFSQGETK